MGRTQTTPSATPASVTTVDVWRSLEKASFAVLSYVTPAGRPRSSGVVYAVANHRLYVVTAPTSWKARHIQDGAQVAVTVPVRRGGALTLVAAIPPATISFHAIVRRAISPSEAGIPERLQALLPPARRNEAVVLVLQPADDFVTYGLGVSLKQMRDPVASGSRVPVA